MRQYHGARKTPSTRSLTSAHAGYITRLFTARVLQSADALEPSHRFHVSTYMKAIDRPGAFLDALGQRHTRAAQRFYMAFPARDPHKHTTPRVLHR